MQLSVTVFEQIGVASCALAAVPDSAKRVAAPSALSMILCMICLPFIPWMGRQHHRTAIMAARRPRHYNRAMRSADDPHRHMHETVQERARQPLGRTLRLDANP